MYQQLTFCPFEGDERIKGKHGSYFKIVRQEKCIRYRVLHESRMRVMQTVCKRIEAKFRENGKTHFTTGLFQACFGNWFKLLTSTSVDHFENSHAKFEEIFINDFKIMMEKFKNSAEYEKENSELNAKVFGTMLIETPSNLTAVKAESQKPSGDLKACDLLLEESGTTPEQYYKEQNQKPSGVLKAGEARVVNLTLKTGNVKIEFETPPTAEDLEYLASYLKYQLS